jgi:type II secretory pathway component PulK
VILPVVLAVLLLLGVVVGGYAFRVHGDVAATRASATRVQVQLAAEAGVERVRLLLRTGRLDMAQWYDNPDEFHRILVWGAGTNATQVGTNQELPDGTPAYRFSIVANDPTDDERFVRFGLTDEAGKLNLNRATEPQLLHLMKLAVGDDPSIDPQTIVDAILDWRDTDRMARGTDGDTEGTYYESLERQPYRVKNGPFDSVEELLLVKGMKAEILYGEDFDRNGLLTPNEDDGDETFPPDNQDGTLNQGLYPYLTVVSYESNAASDNRPRAYLLGDENLVRTELEFAFPEQPDVVEYVIGRLPEFRPRQDNSGGGGGGRRSGRRGQDRQPQGDSGGESDGGDGAAGGEGAGAGAGTADDGPAGGAAGDGTVTGDGAIRGGSRSGTPRGDRRPRNQKGSNQKPQDTGAAGGGDPDGGQEIEPGATGEPMDAAGDPSSEEEEELRRQLEEMLESAEQSGEGGGGPAPRDPATLTPAVFLSAAEDGSPSPLTPADAAVLLDRTTFLPPQQQKIEGLVNVNTAPFPVLTALPGVTEEIAQAIIEARDRLEGEEKASTAWLLEQEVMDAATFVQVSPFITTRAQQFTIESLGHADHMGMISRLEVVVDMLGPMPQTIRYRDITHLGQAYPIRKDDKDTIRVR